MRILSLIALLFIVHLSSALSIDTQTQFQAKLDAYAAIIDM